jgi:putative two-component system response regulator
MNELDRVTILVVDDEELNREMLQVMLADLDVTVHLACNGKDAADQLSAHPETDLILLDLEMPIMDGFELLEMLRWHATLRDIPVIVITAGRSEVTRTLSLGARDFLTKPYDREELTLRVMNLVRTKKLTDMISDLNNSLEMEVARKTADLRAALEFSRDAEYEITLRLGRAAEFRDLETGMHIRRISEMSSELAELAGLSAQDCETLRYASPLHDVGKVGIPDRILLKPARLDDKEMHIMRLHTTIGGMILGEADRYPVLQAGGIIALQHHEKWDGSGYPDGLAGRDIHIFGRIVMIVDVFDALMSVRPYKPAFPLEQVLAIMEKDRGVFFDPELYDLFVAHVEKFTAIRDRLQDSSNELEPLFEFARLSEVGFNVT